MYSGTVKKASKLLTVGWIVRGIQVQNDSVGSRRVLKQVHIDQIVLDLIQMGDRLLVAIVLVGTDGGEFQSIESTLARQRFASITLLQAFDTQGIFLADRHSEQGIEPQLVVIVEIFVTQAKAEDALLEQIHEGVFDKFRIAVIGEAGCQRVDETEFRIDLAQE
jgi:hypothetical protein